MNRHFDDRAGWIAALADDDPERILAVEHARACDPCARALAEGLRVIQLIDRLSLPAVSPEQLERMMVRVEGQIAAEDRRQNILPAVSVGMAWLVEVLIAKRLVATTETVTASLLILSLAIAIAALNRRAIRAAAAAVAISMVFAVVVGTSTSLAPAIGLKCTLLELVAATLPWLVFTRVAGSEARPGQGAAVAAAGALAGHAALHLSCPVSHADAHLLVFHLGGVLLASGLGALATSWRTARLAR